MWPANWTARGGHSRVWPLQVKTHATHFQQVQAYLGFRTAAPLDLYALQTWLGERALEHDKPSLLLQLACDKLRREQVSALASPAWNVWSPPPANPRTPRPFAG